MLIDAHSHLDGYDEIGPSALEAALDEIERHRIFTIGNSMDPASYRRNLEIARRSTFILPVFGVHPWHAHYYADRMEEFAREIDGSPLFGEIGLDRFFVKGESRYAAQEQVFRSFLEAARNEKKAVIIHAKGAESAVLSILGEFDLPRVVIHWYSGSLDVFRQMSVRGYYFTVGAEVLRSAHIRTIAREISPERLLTETDNPGGPKSVLGRAGTPLLIIEVAKSLAKLRGISERQLEEAVRTNMLMLLGDDPRLAAFRARLAG